MFFLFWFLRYLNIRRTSAFCPHGCKAALEFGSITLQWELESPAAASGGNVNMSFVGEEGGLGRRGGGGGSIELSAFTPSCPALAQQSTKSCIKNGQPVECE